MRIRWADNTTGAFKKRLFWFNVKRGSNKSIGKNKEPTWKRRRATTTLRFTVSKRFAWSAEQKVDENIIIPDIRFLSALLPPSSTTICVHVDYKFLVIRVTSKIVRENCTFMLWIYVIICVKTQRGCLGAFCYWL